MKLIRNYIVSFLFCFTGLIQAESLWQQVAQELCNDSMFSSEKTEDVMHLCVANALCSHGAQDGSLNSEMLQTIKSLHLCSQVLPKIARTHLHSGYFCLARNLCNMTDDINVLQQRQALIRELQMHSNISQEISNLLKTLTLIEQQFLINFYPVVPIQQKEEKPSNNFYAFCQQIEKKYLEIRKKIDSNCLMAEGFERCKQISTISAIIAGSYYIYHNYNNTKNWQTCLSLASVMIKSPYYIKQDFDDFYKKYSYLCATKKLLAVTAQINDFLEKDLVLHDFTSQKTVLSQFANNQNLSEQMERFIYLLQHSMFTGEPSYYISWQGMIIEADTLFKEIQHEFIPLWEALGSLDAYISVWSLADQYPNLICLPTWVDSQQPILDLIGYWHPCLLNKKAITNDISLGYDQQPRNLIVTGANAGGKTTAMTAIMISQIMAQSIGISFSKQHVCTPFSSMNTYLDIKTNLEEGESLFMAQAHRARKLKETIMSCSEKNQKSLTILDEIFTGTRSDFAEKVSYKFAEILGQIPYSMSIIATHFPKLTELESANLYGNYQVAPAVINKDGSLSYPYKIIPGISTQNIAEHILKHQGVI